MTSTSSKVVWSRVRVSPIPSFNKNVKIGAIPTLPLKMVKDLMEREDYYINLLNPRQGPPPTNTIY